MSHTRSKLTTVLLIAAAFAGGAVVSTAAEARRPRGGDQLAYWQDRAERYEGAYVHLADTLDAVDRANRRGRRVGNRAIDRIVRRGRAQAARLLETATTAPAEPTAYAMDDRSFATLLAAVDGASFTDDQLRIVAAAATDNWFTATQTIALMGAVSFADTQVEVAVMLHPRLVDHADWYRVIEALPYSSSREELQRRVTPATR